MIFPKKVHFSRFSRSCLNHPEVNPKNILSETSNQKNREDGSHGSKKSKEPFNEIIILRGENVTRNVVRALLQNLVLHLEEEKRKVRSKATTQPVKHMLYPIIRAKSRKWLNF